VALIGAVKERAVAMPDADRRAADVRKLREALKMLYDLLEDFAPAWYEEEIRGKAEAALNFVNADVSDL
jgi:hypothetical protein